LNLIGFKFIKNIDDLNKRGNGFLNLAFRIIYGFVEDEAKYLNAFDKRFNLMNIRYIWKNDLEACNPWLIQRIHLHLDVFTNSC